MYFRSEDNLQEKSAIETRTGKLYVLKIYSKLVINPKRGGLLVIYKHKLYL